MTHNSLVRKFRPMPQASEIPRRKGSSGERKRDPGMEADESQKQERGDRWSKEQGQKVHFLSLMDPCHLNNSEVEPQYQSTEVELYSEVMLWKMIQGRMQCSWTLFQGFQDVHDKQLTRYLLFNANWKILTQNVLIFGYVHRSTNSQKHGPAWKIQSFLSKGICTVIYWQDINGKGNLRKFYWNTVGESFQLGMFICQPSKKTILIRVCERYQTGWQNKKTEPTCEILMKGVDPGEPTSFLDHVFLGCTQTEWTSSDDIVTNYRDFCSNPGFLQEPRKNYLSELQGNLMRKQYLLVPMTWKVMPGNVWKDIVSWRTKRLNNSTQYLLHALMTIISKKKNWIM